MATFRKTTAVLTAVVLLCASVFTLFAYASTANLRYFERGILTDGTNTAYYIIDKDNKTLYLTGDGVTNASTPDYPNAESGPFAGRTDVTCITIEEDVARVGDYVFANMKSVDTLEVQSNLLSSESNMSSKAMSGCTALRHIRGNNSFLSTDILLQVVKGALDIVSGNWVQLALKGFNIIRDGISEDSLSNEVVHAMVNDYIMTGEEIFLGDLDTAVAACQAREQEICYWENAYHHEYVWHVSSPETCTSDGEKMYVCSQCGSFYVEHFGSPLGHDYETEVLYENSCTKEGILKCVCSRCSDIQFTAIPAKGHTDGNYKMTVVPTRASNGTVECHCADCDTVTKTVNVSYTNVTYIRYKVGVNPSANTVSELIPALTSEGYALFAVKDGVVMDDGEKVGTGSIIYYTHPASSKVIAVDTVVLYGDVDGDGIIGADDYAKINSYVMGDAGLFPDGNVFKRAADLNYDGVIDAFDLALLDLQLSSSKLLDQTVPQY
ncbi:MAG: dockerin type I repeat-containing protein [Clostridiales bacterium]|nr:dockerin type I repeat-containing protein [Clostridiales bacterium]